MTHLHAKLPVAPSSLKSKYHTKETKQGNGPRKGTGQSWNTSRKGIKDNYATFDRHQLEERELSQMHLETLQLVTRNDLLGGVGHGGVGKQIGQSDHLFGRGVGGPEW